MPYYRWLKYKEGFSVDFVRYILGRFKPEHAAIRVLDPFAGAGTTLTAAAGSGCQATGIELLPVGTAAIRARLAADRVDIDGFEKWLVRLRRFQFEPLKTKPYRFPHLRITERAFPPDTARAISAYQRFLGRIDDEEIRSLFWFACMGCLEDVSYTRKDGQYLRWDSRSGKSMGSGFNKGPMPDFKQAILGRLEAMLHDIRHRNGGRLSRRVHIVEGSCLGELPRLKKQSFDLVITSPPYCNRYDYTRTYALELAFLGYDEAAVAALRQSLLSATVENKAKRENLRDQYCRLQRHEFYGRAVANFDCAEGLHEVLGLLYAARNRGELNNNNIPVMVENYFFEMNIVIHELARVLTPGGHMVMVNDNVQYHGEEIPLDLILSDFAAAAGLSVDAIWVLPRGKGNSSQQMGAHGRNEIRKCVYVWGKPRMT
ncbi:MAG: site-specific DNA-methyltransferase [Acidobacteria bacterium]|nr:site-specific DNA-methyltransferase [Acidobacteriota bacterium]